MKNIILNQAPAECRKNVRLFNKDRKTATENRIDRENQTALPIGNAVFYSLLTCCRIAYVFIRKYAFA